MTEQELKAIYGYYLEHSFRYYQLDAPVISDHTYDEMCKTLLANWNRFEHKYKHLTNVDDLQCGTGMHINEDTCPVRIQKLVKQYPDTPLQDIFDMPTPCNKCGKPKRYRNHNGNCTQCEPMAFKPDAPVKSEPVVEYKPEKPGKKKL